jgi:DNA-binding Lrp family transcriptional regulator
MRTDLNLKGNELLAYAIIYGFSQEENCMFTGSANYIAEWLGVTRRSVVDILKKLVEKGLILKHQKTINGVTLCDYEINKTSLPTKKVHRGCEKISQGGSDVTSHHILDIDNIEDTLVKKEIYKEKSALRFIKPTIEELETYIKEKKYCIDALKFYSYYESNGWKVGKNKMTNWKAALVTWEKNNKERNSDKKKSSMLF